MQQHTRLCFIPTMLHWHKDPEHLFCCQFVMWRSASNCAAGLPKLSPPPHSVHMSVHLKALEKTPSCFQGSEGKTSQRLQPGWRYIKSWLCVWKDSSYGQLRAVWAWNGDKIRSRQRQWKAGNICELERCCSLSASRVPYVKTEATLHSSVFTDNSK